MPCIFHRQKLKSQSISNFFYFQIILLRIYCHVILSTQVNINLTAVNVPAIKCHTLTIERKDQQCLWSSMQSNRVSFDQQASSRPWSFAQRDQALCLGLAQQSRDPCAQSRPTTTCRQDTVLVTLVTMLSVMSKNQVKI